MFRILIAACLLATAATAEESRTLFIGGGIICDTIEDVERAIKQEPQQTCGRLQGRFMATVTPLDPFEHNGVRFMMARYDLIQPVPWGNQTQFGFWGAPERIEPAALEFDA